MHGEHLGLVDRLAPNSRSRALGSLLGRLRRLAPVTAVLALAACAPAGTTSSSVAPTTAPGAANPAATTATPAKANAAAAYDWRQVQPATAPLARNSAGFAYDGADHTVVLTGGRAGCGPDAAAYIDTWTWSRGAWTLQHPKTQGPASAIIGAPIAYDDATKTVVAVTPEPCGTSATWQWNGTDWTSSSNESASNPVVPEPRGAMAYDPASASMLLWTPAPPVNLSGTTGRPPWASSTWRWKGSTWTPLSPAVSPPPSIGPAHMAYDEKSRQLLLYGEYSQAMWAWDGATWTQLSLAAAPPARVASSMVYDAALGEVLLFGGATTADYRAPSNSDQRGSYTPGTPLNDLWAWDGTAWQQLHPATSPPARFFTQMAYDAAAGEILLFGGARSLTADSADTWTYGPV